MAKSSGLIWRGDETQVEAIAVLKAASVEIVLRIEGEAKKELHPGHGKLTGTLQRSLHAASPGYNFGGDHVKPSVASPERGGGEVAPEVVGNAVKTAVGTGMEYAMRIHLLYGYLIHALHKVRPLVLGIVAQHAGRRRA